MTLVRFTIATTLLICVAAAPVGCGGSEPSEKDVRAIADEFLAGSPGACHRMSPAFLNSQFGGTIAKCRLDMQGNAVDDDVRIQRISFSGSRATVVFGRADDRAELGFAKLDNDWKITRVRLVSIGSNR
jgi:hypothetical protein